MSHAQTVPGLILAASSSNSGKTTLSLGLQRLLARKGLLVAPAKCGPDYIDPAFHEVASNYSSVNLDPWAMRPSDLVWRSRAQAQGRDILFVEGVMGLFDGTVGGAGSTANLAKTLNLPVFLVLDVKGQAQTAAAIAAGIRDHDRDINIAGVILNRVGSPMHVSLLREAFDKVGLPVVGTVGQSDTLGLPSRHLGLVQAGEYSSLGDRIDAIADHMANDVDLDLMLSIATEQSQLATNGQSNCMAPANDDLLDGLRNDAAASSPLLRLPPLGQHIAIAKDAAFTFIYPHILTDWREQGAALSFFSPLADEAPAKDADAIYLPGGYPELHLDTLTNAMTFKSAMVQAANENKLIFAECGGYMTLGKSIKSGEGYERAMLGLLPLRTSFYEPKLNLGYRKLSPIRTPQFTLPLVGHEFHYATIEWQGSCDPLFEATNASGTALDPMGQRIGSVHGSFAHIIGQLPPA